MIDHAAAGWSLLPAGRILALERTKGDGSANRRITPPLFRTVSQKEGTMDQGLAALKARLADVHNLGMAGAVLDWDQQTYMPPGGVGARAEAKATVGKLAHRLFTDAETGRLLDRAAAETAGMPEESDEAAFVRVARRDYDRATRIPSDL